MKKSTVFFVLSIAAFIAGGVMMVSAIFKIGRLDSYGMILAELPVSLEGSESERVLRIAGRDLPETDQAAGPVAMVLQLDLRSSDMPFGRNLKGSSFSLGIQYKGIGAAADAPGHIDIVRYRPEGKNFYDYGKGGERVIFTGENDDEKGRYTRIAFRVFDVKRPVQIHETLISIGRDTRFDTRVLHAGASLFSPERDRSESLFSGTVLRGFGIAAAGIVLLFAGILTRKPGRRVQ
jgi:hypothetical protein